MAALRGYSEGIVAKAMSAIIVSPATNTAMKVGKKTSSRKSILILISTRRIPVYLLIDTSVSLKGEPIESVNTPA